MDGVIKAKPKGVGDIVQDPSRGVLLARVTFRHPLSAYTVDMSVCIAWQKGQFDGEERSACENVKLDEWAWAAVRRKRTEIPQVSEFRDQAPKRVFEKLDATLEKHSQHEELVAWEQNHNEFSIDREK
ncbi:unnamed protein product [Prunus armeniaca]